MVLYRMSILLEQDIDSIIVSYVEARIIKYNGNRRKTAESLGISIRTLRLWIIKYPALHQYKIQGHKRKT